MIRLAGEQRSPRLSVATSNTITLDCGSLRVEFQRACDRWQHAIGLVDKETFQQFAKSIEGTPEDLWPQSPAFQELHVEQRGTSCVAFLTGMAGKSHWSASVLCEPERHRATFEIACRCKQNPEWIGSLYQTSEWLEVRTAEQSVWLKLPREDQRIVATTPDDLGLIPEYGSQPAIFFSPKWEPAEKTQTLLWKYIFELRM